MPRAPLPPPPPAPVGAGAGFGLSLLLNLVVAGAVWVALAAQYGVAGTDAISYHYEAWIAPTLLVLGLTTAMGLGLVASRGRRRLGASVVAGAVTAGLLDLVGSFVYFVGLGS